MAFGASGMAVRSFVHWHPHELRHSSVSLLSASGLRLEDVAAIVGHASIRMTAEVYRHHVQPTITAGKAAMDELLGNEAKSPGLRREPKRGSDQRVREVSERTPKPWLSRHFADALLASHVVWTRVRHYRGGPG